MKVYIITDNIDNGIVASNIVNRGKNTGIISETRSDDPKALLADLRDNIGSTAEMAIIICENPGGLAISANKISGVRAATCKDAEDAMDARKNAKANVIIISTQKASKTNLGEVIRTWLTSASEAEDDEIIEEVQKTKAPSNFLGGIKDAANRATKAVEKPMKEKPAARQRDSEPEGNGILASIKKKGFSKALKEELGLED